uniref:Uncharacterized protein n=1 Tax=Quercus lobata TaxID=97700 RepID=A0A7N2MR58_QUELO
MFYQLRIYERSRDSLRSIFMGKGSAKRLLFNVEELISKQSHGQFAKSFCEGDKCFILQLGSNTYDSFLLISELIHGLRKGSIVVPEGKSGSGWRGKNKTAWVHNSNPRDFNRNRDTYKESILGQREQLGAKILSNFNRNNRDTYKENIIGQREQLGVKILPTIKGIENNDIISELTLDLFMHMEHGKDGRWAIVWSEVNEVGPKVVQPIKPTVNLDSSKAVLSGFTGSCAEVTHGLGIQDSRFTSDMVISLAMAVSKPPILKEVSSILCRHPWVVQNRFSPLSNLGNGMEAEFGEGEAHEEERSSPHDDTTQQRLVDSVGEFQTDYGLHLLPWETSGVDDNGCGSREKDNCVLECEPLSRWEPNDLNEGLLVQDSVEGTQVTESRPPSN